MGIEHKRPDRMIPLAIGLLIAIIHISAASAEDTSLQVAETILLYQRNNGGWPKNYDRSRVLSKADKQKLIAEKGRGDSTFDNGATHREMRLLAKVYRKTRDDRFRRAFLSGLAFTLDAQYENGGWPQRWPNPTGYHAHITFNDGAMIGVMTLLRDIARGGQPYGFVPRALRTRCKKAVARGTRCILKCQIVVDGKKTAWCAQHDAKTFAPRKARSYELPSISGSESVGVIRFLMQIDRPTPEIIDAVQSAVAWLDAVKLQGIKQVRKKDPSLPKGWDKVVVKDPSAPPLWARFYKIGSNRPIFCSRDGVPKKTLAEISYERRNGYSWLGPYAATLLTRDYPAWQAVSAPKRNVLRGKK